MTLVPFCLRKQCTLDDFRCLPKFPKRYIECLFVMKWKITFIFIFLSIYNSQALNKYENQTKGRNSHKSNHEKQGKEICCNTEAS